MRTLAHVSDLHFGTETPEVVEALREDLLRLGPDLLVVSGDLTQRARPRQFRAAVAFLDSLPFPRVVVPGNHDIPLDEPLLRIFAPYARYHKYVDPARQVLWRDEELVVLGLDTTRSSLWKDGRLSRAQIALIRSAFSNAPRDAFRVLVTHHPFLPPLHSPTPSLVGRAAEALDVLAECGAELLLAGHLHLGYHGDAKRHHLKMARSILAAQAGTATSRRTRGEPNAYNAIVLDRGRARIAVRESHGGPFRERAAASFVEAEAGWVPLRPSAGSSPS